MKRLFLLNDTRLIPPHLTRKLLLILSRLAAAESVQGMNMPGYYLHPLKGKWQDHWSVRVSGNVRLVFRFDSGNKEFYDVDLVDYH